MQACAHGTFSLILDGVEHVKNFSHGHHSQKQWNISKP